VKQDEKDEPQHVPKLEVGITRDLSKRALRRGKQKAGYETEDRGREAQQTKNGSGYRQQPHRATPRARAQPAVQSSSILKRFVIKPATQKEKPTRPNIGNAWVSVLLNL
jgi:hypothetical protein